MKRNQIKLTKELWKDGVSVPGFICPAQKMLLGYVKRMDDNGGRRPA